MAVRKVISFRDLDGNPVEAEYYFQLGMTDMVEMDFVHGKDVKQHLTEMFDNADTKEILALWKELLFRAVGKRVGGGLDKSEAVRTEFVNSGAYEKFFGDLFELPDGGAEFFASIMPDKLKQMAKEADENKEYSLEELLTMPDEEFDRIAGPKMNRTREYTLIAMQRQQAKKTAA